MHVTEFIGRHLEESGGYPIEKKESTCSFSGEKIVQCVPNKKIIGALFTDQEYIRGKSGYSSVYVARCLKSSVLYGDKRLPLRNISYIVTENELKTLKKQEVLPFIVSPPKPPFVLAVTFSGQKYKSFKGKVNYSKSSFSVITDLGEININHQALLSILPILREWYSVIPEKSETKAQPTWFTKDEILFGLRNYKKIEDYVSYFSEEKFFKEDQEIRFFRGSLFLKLIVHLLEKKVD